MKILLSNDDGGKSPLLFYFAKALKTASFCMQLRIVVPAEERSWAAQFISRFGSLQAKATTLGENEAFLVNGSPADCVSLGIANLFGDKPDLILSGINMGVNETLPYFLSSGTIGAAQIGFLHGIPAIALSARLPFEVYSRWTKHTKEISSDYSDYFSNIATSAVEVISSLINGEFWKEADIASVNFPWSKAPLTKVTFSQLSKATFEALFQSNGNDCFEHTGSVVMQPTATYSNKLPLDSHVLETGDISISLIKYDLCKAPSEQLLSAFKRTDN